MAQTRTIARIEIKRLDAARILVVEARYYEDISDALLKGAATALDTAGVAWDRVTVAGALEIPAAVAMLTDVAQRARKPYDGVVALGCVIRGETSHYDIVANESARALVDLSVARLLPIGNGILTVDREAQAVARADPLGMDKGGFAARAVLGLIALKRKTQPRRAPKTGARKARR